MTDLTLNEGKGFSKEKLGQILREEARKMFNADSLEKDLGGASGYSYTLFKHKQKRTDVISRYWTRITNFIYTKGPKTFLNLARNALKLASRMCVHLFCRASS